MAFSGLTGVDIPATSTPIEDIPKVEEQTLTIERKETEKIITTESYVRSYFSDTPILAEVAKCESTFRQFGKDGKPIRGKVNKGDIGVMQINEYYHRDEAEGLGLDIDTLHGNVAYAKHLYETEGLKPWKASSKCWNKAIVSGEIAMK